MLLGMALYQWGFVTGQWSRRRSSPRQTMLIGYGLGLPLVIVNFYYGYSQQIANTEAFIRYMEQHPILWNDLIYPFQRILLVMAHASLIILLIQSEKVQGLLNRLGGGGADGLYQLCHAHTLICTFIFFGYGLNLYAEWQFYQLYFLVAAIWVLQLFISPIWLKYYQFGPLEWVWRKPDLLATAAHAPVNGGLCSRCCLVRAYPVSGQKTTRQSNPLSYLLMRELIRKECHFLLMEEHLN